MRVAYLYFMTDNPDRCSELWTKPKALAARSESESNEMRRR
jgi:hypothetical protein